MSKAKMGVGSGETKYTSTHKLEDELEGATADELLEGATADELLEGAVE